VLNSPRDKIIWDVSHQSYPHKILTNRDLTNIRQYNGLSGFTKRSESKHDIFGAGHASTSISAAIGVAQARDLANKDFSVFAVIGDSAMSGGLAFEGLNNAQTVKGNLVVVLNDNEMSISTPTGSLSKTITGLRISKFYTSLKKNTETFIKYIPFLGKPLAKSIEKLVHRTGWFVINETSNKEVSGYFHDLGFTYLGPIDGHNLPILMSAINYAKEFKKSPILLHILTKKGYGYTPAEENPTKYHGISGKNSVKKRSYTDVFSEVMIELAEKHSQIVAITAAMKDGTGLRKFKSKYPNRFFDVGIAEGHAVTFAGGLATQGIRPVVAIYSTFLQRAYDQLIHDIALQKLPVIFAIDRAGLVGEDGPTHHGTFDIGFLRTIPNLIIASPKDSNELKSLFYTALQYTDGPFAIRYPRGAAYSFKDSEKSKVLPIGKWEIIKGDLSYKKTIITTGRMVKQVTDALNDSNSFAIINARFIKPLDMEMLSKLSGDIYVIEEGNNSGGLGEAIAAQIINNNVTLNMINLGDKFITSGNINDLLKDTGLSVDQLKKVLRNG